MAHLSQDLKLIKACKNDTKNLNILNVALYVINNTHCKYSLPLSNMFTDSLCLIFILCWSTEKIIVGLCVALVQ